MTAASFLSSVESAVGSWLSKAANYLSGTTTYTRPTDQAANANSKAAQKLPGSNPEVPCIVCMQAKNKQLIAQSIDKNWSANSDNCSGFLRAVGNDFGITFDGENANSQIAAMKKEDGQWTSIGTDKKKAMDLAKEGYLVVAGKAEAGHGHVAIVLPKEDPDHPGYPMASWGMLDSVGAQEKSIRWSFSPSDIDSNKVEFFAIPIQQ